MLCSNRCDGVLICFYSFRRLNSFKQILMLLCFERMFFLSKGPATGRELLLMDLSSAGSLLVGCHMALVLYFSFILFFVFFCWVPHGFGIE